VVVAVSGNSRLATDDVDVAKRREEYCYDDDNDAAVARSDDDRCPGDGTSLDDVHPELESFSHDRFL